MKNRGDEYDLNIFCTRPTIITTGGEWNLIHSRNIVLHEKYNVKIKMNVLISTDSFPEVPDHFKMSPYPIEIILSRKIRSDIIRAANSFYRKAAQLNYKAILADDTGYALFANKYFESYHGKLIIDMHGNLAEIYEYSTNKWHLYTLFRYCVYAFQQNRFIQKCDAALVVSSMLEKHIKKINPKTKTYRVPCACNQVLSYEEYQANRNYWREKLKIGINDKVFAYAGGMNKWQAISEHLEIISGCCKKNARTRIVFFTTDRMHINSMIESNYKNIRDKITIMSVDSKDLVQALCVADIGLLVRKNDRTNNSAFPNKFDEYLAAGLRVITTAGLTDVATVVANNIGLGLLVDYNNIKNEIDKILFFAETETAMTMDKFLKTQEIRKSFSHQRRLKDFAEYLKS